MKYLKHFLVLGALLFNTATHAATWLTDPKAAYAQAVKEGKTVLINFTGSDWCPWCIKLKQEIFSQPEFEAFAAKNFVLVEIDFPKRQPLSPDQQKVNAGWAAQYKVEGFPTVVFVDRQGREIHRSGYRPGGAKLFIQNVSAAIGVPFEGGPAVAGASGTRPAAAEPVRELPLFGGAPAAPPVRYTNLVLKNISGPKNHRFALVNNQTLAVGDTARVKLGDREVRVHCMEIRDRSVVVSVDGQQGARELVLRD
jgi:thioredoxin-related protein